MSMLAEAALALLLAIELTVEDLYYGAPLRGRHRLPGRYRALMVELTFVTRCWVFAVEAAACADRPRPN